MIKTQEDFLEKYLPLTLLQGFEKVVQGLHVRGSWRPNITEIFWPQTYGRHVVSFLFFDAQPEVQRPLCWVMAFFTASSPDLNSSGPEGPFVQMWLSLPHLVYNSVRSSTQLALELNWLVELNWVI